MYYHILLFIAHNAMLQLLGSLIKFSFILLIILLVATIVLTISTTYLLDKNLNTYGDNKGVYVFEKD